MTLPEWLQDRANSEGPALRKAHMAKMRKMTTLLHQELLKQTVEKHRLNAEIQALATEARNKPPRPKHHTTNTALRGTSDSATPAPWQADSLRTRQKQAQSVIDGARQAPIKPRLCQK